VGNCAGYFQINLNCHKVSKNFFNDTYEQTKIACEIYSYYRKIHNGSIIKTLNSTFYIPARLPLETQWKIPVLS